MDMDLKYNYPPDISDSLLRKKFRANIRSKMASLEKKIKAVKKEHGKDSKEYLEAKKKLKKLKKKYLSE